MRIYSRIATLFMVAIFVAACVRPIYNVQDHPITSRGKQSLTMNDIAEVVMQSALNRGWEASRMGEDTVFITYSRKNYSATAQVFFTYRSYSIEYDSSTNLKYSNGMIHRNYNNWVKRLENDIARNLDKLAYSLN